MEAIVQGFRLSPRQRCQWLAGWYGPGFEASCAIRLEGALDTGALRHAVQRVVARHEILRTSFQSCANLTVPLQVVEEEAALLWREERAGGRLEGWIEDLLAGEASLPDPQEEAPPLHCLLFREGPEQSVLMLRLPSLCADARSLGNLVQEIAGAYEAVLGGEDATLEEVVQYVQVSEWQNNILETNGAEVARGQEFWHGRAERRDVVLPFERRPDEGAGEKMRVLLREVDATVHASLGKAAAQAKTPLRIFLLACWSTLLRRLTAETEIGLGYVADGRRYEDLQGVLGPLAISLPLRMKLPEGRSFRSILKAAEAAVQEAVRWQEYVYAEDWWRGREGNREAGFEFQEQVPRREAAGVIFSLLGRQVRSEPAKLKLCCAEGEDGLYLSLQYDSGRFDETDVRRLLAQFEALAASAARDLETPIGALALLGEAERRRLLVDFNRTAVSWPAASSVLDLFAEHARQTPDRVAVVAEEHWLTFGELDARSSRLARRLRSLEAGPDRVVALALERSAEVVVGILGSWKAGAAYLPLDVEQPGERLASLLEESRAVAVLLRKDRLESLPRGGACAICITGGGGIDGPEVEGPAPAPVLPETLAYVIYTSGSTGRPKGVAVTHGSLLNYVAGVLERLSLPAGASFATVSSFAADLGNTSVFAALCSGGSLHVVSEERVADAAAMAEYMEREGIDCLKIVPSHLEALGGARVLPRRRLVLGGEGSRREWVESLGAGSGCQILNHYGPTEATVGVLTCEATESFGAPLPSTVPLGRPLANSRIYVLDRDLAPLPLWVSGELYIAGAGLARGYLGGPELTAARFVPDPFSAEPGGRMYRTGDLARHRPEGVIEFLGRDDDQVKLRGYRIEPGEVEAALRRYPTVSQAAVIAREEKPGEKRLVAYVVPQEGGRFSAPELRSFVGGILPAYMVPGDFVSLRSLPLTRNGKLDRAALPAPERGAGETGREPASPRTPFEELLAGIWAEVLGMERVGVEDNFFDIGGHSLLATRVISRVRDAFAVELPVRALFEAPTVAGLAVRIGEARRAGEAPWMPPLQRVPREGHLPLSFAQQRLWFLHQMDPASPVYNTPFAFRLSGPLVAPALAASLTEVVRRHETLRTTLVLAGDRPVQSIAPPAQQPLPTIDLSALPAEGREQTARRLGREEASRPFDLARPPVVRTLLLRLAEREHVVLFTIHHVSGDGWSSEVLSRELVELYGAAVEGRPARLPELPVQYVDFAVWQRSWLHGEVLEAQIEYWRRQLAGAPALLEMPLDRPRPPVQSFRGARRRVQVPAEVASSLAALGRREGATGFMTLLAGFQALLHRYSGQESVVVGTPIANRERAELERLIGFFVNTLALRADFAGAPGFAGLLARVRERALGAYVRQDLPFEKLVDELAPQRDMSYAPVFQALFVYQNAPRQAAGLRDLSLRPFGTDGEVARFDLTLVCAEIASRAGRGLAVHLDYNADLFEEATADRLLRLFVHLLARAAAGPERPIGELELLDEEEHRQVVLACNATGRERAEQELCLHGRFERQAALTPEAPAVVSDDGVVRYGELAEWAGRIADRLRRLGVGPEDRVGVCLERSAAALAALLGTLRAGAAYVPLDPEWPRERLEAVAADAGLAALLTRADLAAAQGLAPREVPVEELRWGAPAQLPWARPVTPEAAAYVIYTSGSTGAPKGVVISHRAAANFVLDLGETLDLAPGDRLLLFAPLSFDASVLQIFPVLSRGAAVVVHPNPRELAGGELPGFCERHGVTVLDLPAPLWRQWIEDMAAAGQTPPGGIRTFLTGGESVPAARVRTWAALTRRRATFLSSYGPTEATVTSTVFLTDSAEAFSLPEGKVPMGHPLANVRAYVLDARMQPVPTGVAGELHLAGDGLARGYLGQPGLTAASFVPDAVGDVPGGRLYRTGDLARRLPGGDLEFLGRADTQVKIRGFRVELSEVEAVLGRHPDLAECVAAVREDQPGDLRLVAYGVPQPGRAPGAPELRAFAAERLPQHMVPSTVVLLSALPVLASGKVDRAALPAPEHQVAEGTWLAPRTPVEEILAGIWAELLGREGVGAADNFFELGGHSLLATQVMSRLRGAFGVDIPLRDLFEAATLSDLAARVDAALRDSAGLLTPPLVPRDPSLREGQPLTLSFAQQRLWFIDQLEPGSPLYNIPVALRIEGPLHAKVLALCLGEIVRRHETLRTVFVAIEGSPAQVVQPAEPFRLTVVDLSGLPGREREALALTLAGEEAARPFDLGRGPQLRCVLLRLAEGDHVAALTMHHIVSDGWSMGILIREVTVLYAEMAEGRPSPLPELPVQYADFALWQRRWLSGEVLESQLAYWKEQLAGAPPVLDLPTDRPRRAVRRGHGARELFALPAESLSGLKALVREQGATLFMGLLTALAILLERYTGQEDLTVGTPIAGRNRVETEDLIGFFVNTLVLRGDLTGGPSFRELLGRIRETAVAAHTHQDVPFERMVQELAPERSFAYTPLFQVVLSFQNAPVGGLEIRELRLRPVARLTTMAKFDLTFSFEEHGGGLIGAVEYATDLFDAASINRLVLQYGRLLTAALVEPERRADELPLLPAAERHQALVEWNDTAVALAEESATFLIQGPFEIWARRTPDAVAAVWRAETLTYGALEERADRLAHHLVHLGAGPGSLIGIHLRRGPGMVVALLAILKAGAAYVPLEIGHPPARLRWILDTLKISCVITETTQQDNLPALPHRICLDRSEPADLSRPIGPIRPSIARRTSPDDLAYIIFTSGSTGTPKGVMVRHRPVMNLLRWAYRAFAFSPADRVLFITSLSFDLSVFDIFGLLGAGGSIRIATEEEIREPELLLRALTEEPITFWDSAPAALEQTVPFLAGVNPRARPALRLVFLSGDWIPVTLPDRIRDRFPGARVMALGGATEATVWSNVFPVERVEPSWTSIPYGRPIENARYHVLDAWLAPCPVGVPGDLYIGGDCLADGYAREPELTADKFLPDPWSATPGGRLYRTGDRARYWPDGNLEFLGRLDHQVKIRGFRIELGEIETALATVPGVREAAVVVRESRSEGGSRDRRLVAYVAGDVTADTLRRSLREKLPDYMVPSTFSWLEALPLTASGKVNRSALPMPEDSAAGRESAAPRTPFEELLAGIWAETFQVERVGVEDNFFDLGGHSLLAVRVISRIREAFGVTLPVRTLFDRPTVGQLGAEIASALRDEAAVAAAPPLLAVSREGPLPLSFAQRRLWFLDQLEPGSAAYNLPLAVRMEGGLAPRLLAQALARVIERHEVLRTTFVAVDGEPFQVVAPAVAVHLPVIDLAGLSEPRRQAEAAELFVREAAVPFDLARGPLLRVKLLRLAAGDQLLLLTTHHVVADGESLELLIDEAASFYVALSRGERPSLRELPLQYADYASWQRRWLQGEVLERELAYWRRQLAGDWSPLRLPVDHRPPARRTHRGRHLAFQLSPAMNGAMRALCVKEAATSFMFVLAAFAVLLARYARQEEVVMGVDHASRPNRETEGLIGFFVNMLVLRTDLSGDPSFRELLRRVREVCLGAFAHQEMPYERLVEELRPELTLGGAPLFQVVLNFTTSRKRSVDELQESAGLRLQSVRGEEHLVRFDLMLRVQETDGDLGGSWMYSTEVFEPATILSLHERFLRLIQGILEHPEASLGEIEREAAAREERERRRARLDQNRKELRAAKPKVVQL